MRALISYFSPGLKICWIRPCHGNNYIQFLLYYGNNNPHGLLWFTKFEHPLKMISGLAYGSNYYSVHRILYCILYIEVDIILYSRVPLRYSGPKNGWRHCAALCIRAHFIAVVFTSSHPRATKRLGCDGGHNTFYETRE